MSNHIDPRNIQVDNLGYPLCKPDVFWINLIRAIDCYSAGTQVCCGPQVADFSFSQDSVNSDQ